ncbi:MAG: methyltransferase domain-containing protein [Bacteroidota bacterium]
MNTSSSIILVLYTTLYRKGGAQFTRVAQTMTHELSALGPVRMEAVESKREVRAVLAEIRKKSQQIFGFHFIGHSGMYGPMFGTTDFPEQFSPFEWQHLDIPFAENGEAFFHCCRSARWFAPFFARTFKVPTSGYHWYTAFSTRKDRYKLDWPEGKQDDPLYAFGCPGKKSHGLLASVKKHTGLQQAEALKQFLPAEKDGDSSYDQVAELYDAVFQDIKVRQDEWNWLNQHIPWREDLRVIDIGCGNGALLREMSPRIGQGTGLDASAGILDRARQFNADRPNLNFVQINGPQLPLADHSVDLAISMLSFRYLDWDPLMHELKRVLKPGGKFLVVDMVTKPASWREFPQFIAGKLRQQKLKRQHPAFAKALHSLVRHPDWKTMLQYNPIRAEHEMKWFLESRFPGQKTALINVGWHARILAFDSGPIEEMLTIPISYP